MLCRAKREMGDPMTAFLRAVSLLAVLGSLTACSLPDQSPEEAAAFRNFQVGCQPGDASGYDRVLRYCNGGG
jgi:hypothetical protein